MRWFLVTALLLAGHLARAQSDWDATLEHQSVERQYVLHLPPGSADAGDDGVLAPPPWLHGRGGSNSAASSRCRPHPRGLLTCTEGGAVQLLRIADGGRELPTFAPDDKLLGPGDTRNHDLETAEELWRFFQLGKLPSPGPAP